MPVNLKITEGIAVALLPLVLFSAADGAQGKSGGREESCGPLALQTCMMLLGRPVEARVCADLAGTDERGNTTMAGLATASRQLGRHVVSVNLTGRELALLNRPAILHVSYPNAPEHFSVFACYRDGRFELVNPTLGPPRELLSEQQLRLIWDGRCLVFSKSSLFDRMKLVSIRLGKYVAAFCGLAVGYGVVIVIRRKRDMQKATTAGAWKRIIMSGSLLLVISGAVVQAASSEVSLAKPKHSLVLGMDVLDLGDHPIGAAMVRDTWFANVGQGSFEIDKKRTKASCSCLRVTASNDTLSHGEKGVLSLRLAPRRLRGEFEYQVCVATDQEEKPQTLAVKGNVVGPGVAFPPRLYFGRVHPRETRTRVFVYVAKYPDCEVLCVESSSPAIKCSVLQTRPGLVKVGVSLVELPGDGPFSGCIRLVLRDRAERVIEVPYDGTVVQDP